jgi:uncharacterized protein (TIGR03435 family)
LFFSAAGIAAVAALSIFSAAEAEPHAAPHATPSLARAQQQSQSQAQSQTKSQSQMQNAPAAPPTSAPPLAYEYESAKFKKSSGPGPDGRMGITAEPGGLSAWHVTATQLIAFAYNVQQFRVVGGPDWLAADRFDVDANIGGDVDEALHKLGRDERPQVREQMLQSLLAKNLKLAVHRETREIPIYILAIADGGSKLKEAKPGDLGSIPVRGPAGVSSGTSLITTSTPGDLVFRFTPILVLAKYFEVELGRPVVDKTGLAGIYDFELKWKPHVDKANSPKEGTPGGKIAGSILDPNDSAFFKALQEKLGLELDAVNPRVEVIVVDHIEKPSGN